MGVIHEYRTAGQASCERCGHPDVETIRVSIDSFGQFLCAQCIFINLAAGRSVSNRACDACETNVPSLCDECGTPSCSSCDDTDRTLKCVECARSDFVNHCDDCDSGSVVLCSDCADGRGWGSTECENCSDPAVRCRDCSVRECEDCSDAAELCLACASPRPCEGCAADMDRFAIHYCEECHDKVECVVCNNSFTADEATCPSCKKSGVKAADAVTFDPNMSYRVHYTEEV